MNATASGRAVLTARALAPFLLVGTIGCAPSVRLTVLDAADVELPRDVLRVGLVSDVDPMHLPAGTRAAMEGFVARASDGSVGVVPGAASGVDAVVRLTALERGYASDGFTRTDVDPSTGDTEDVPVVWLDGWVKTSWVVEDPDGTELDRLEGVYTVERWAREDGDTDVVMPSEDAALVELAFSAGAAYASRIVPIQASYQRQWFASGDPRLAASRLAVQAGDWRSAARWWREVESDPSSSPRVRARALHDLALYWEVRGNLHQAVLHIERAAAYHDNPRILRYRSVLRDQAARQRTLREPVALEGGESR